MSNLPPKDDELDGLLDDAFEQFTAAPPKPKASSIPAAAKAGASMAERKPAADVAAATDAATDSPASGLEEEFARQLAKGMEDLLKDTSALGGDGAGDSEQVQAALDQLLKQMSSLQADLGIDSALTGAETKDKGVGRSAAGTATSQEAAAGSKPADAETQGGAEEPMSFQNKIKATMDKLKESSDRVEAETAGGLGVEGMDMMEELMRQIDQAGDDGQLDSLVDDVIGQLMSKDILYQPLKDLDVEYPKYLAKNKDTLPAEEYERYEKQHSYVREIIAQFDASKDGTANDPKIVELMQKMQDCGQPPNELLKVLAPDMELDASGQAKIPEAPNCNIM
ncbi:Peroxisome chaperone and import receptor [Dipsacomyces acuminosporus]|nr:Peroxisome chaperone and import receptor [Dipsacomyces acuminosporus]